MNNKDVRLVVITGSELKDRFKAACDGREMTYVIRNFIIDYCNKYEKSKKQEEKEG